MIKTDWVKCDKKDCNLVAFYRLLDKWGGYKFNACEKHYEEFEKKWFEQ